MAKLVPYQLPVKPRKGGLLAGKVWEAEDCWEQDVELSSLLTEGELEPKRGSISYDDVMQVNDK